MKIGDMLYHESRYWAQRPTVGEVPGWNARYLPYVVTRITEKHIYATGCAPDGKTSNVQFHRRPVPNSLEGVNGKQYHSRFHEYFYVKPPKAKPRLILQPMASCAHALLLLGISPPYNESDVTRAYKRLAKMMHPDAGGSHDEFIRLKNARDVAMRGY